MTRADPQFNLRLPVELKRQIEEAATENGRSLTTEIVKRLEESFSRGQTLTSMVGMFQETINEMDQQQRRERVIMFEALAELAEQHAASVPNDPAVKLRAESYRRSAEDIRDRYSKLDTPKRPRKRVPKP